MSHHRQPLYAPHGAVATSQPLAAAAGLSVLRRGGNAVDAALATAITLTVLQPGSNDIGGDLFVIVWDGHRLHGLNGSGRSPAGLTREVVLAATGGRGAPPTSAHGGAQSIGPAMPARGWLSVTVPGAPAAWRDLHDRFGVLPFAELFVDAIGYAEHGFPVSPNVAAGWARSVATYRELTGATHGGGLHADGAGLRAGGAGRRADGGGLRADGAGRRADGADLRSGGDEFAEWARVFTVDGGRAPRPGERWRNPDAARTLRRIAATSAAACYTGDIAEALVRYAERSGGPLREADLTGHTSTWVDPVHADYRGHEVWELPPNGQGLAALLALNILDGVELAPMSPADRLHWQIEATKLGFADAHAYVADPDRVPVPTAELLSPAYARARRRRVTDAAGDPGPGDPARGGTVYLCTADADGMMVSLIQSTYLGFGSFVVPPGLGFGLQNRGAGFSLDPAHPNVVAPGKRPFHTIIPGFLTREGAPVGPFGVMGGHMQPQGHVQLVSATLDGGLDPQAALERPRWYWHAGRSVLVEPALLAEESGRQAVARLRSRGHEITVEAEPSTFGYGQAIWRLPDGGYVAGSEPRADGCAIGC